MKVLPGAYNPKFKRLLAEHRLDLYRIAFSWCHQPSLADDLAQEAIEKALKKHRQLRDPKTVKSWLYRILSNCWYDHLRRRRETVDIDDFVLIDPETPDSQHQRNQIVTEVRLAISKLPMGQRQIVTLIDIDGCSYIEVAEILDVPIGTVMSRLHRARKALQKLLLDTEFTKDQVVQPLRTVK